MMNVTCTNLCGKPVYIGSLSRPLGEEGNPLYSPDVSSTRLRGGPDTTPQVTSKVLKIRIPIEQKAGSESARNSIRIKVISRIRII
jgi:hypothetical protein